MAQPTAKDTELRLLLLIACQLVYLNGARGRDDMMPLAEYQESVKHCGLLRKWIDQLNSEGKL